MGEKKHLNSLGAFTLVELMIVISIIGLLVVALFPKLQGSQERSRDTGRLTAIKSMAGVLKTFYAETGKKYPSSPANVDYMYDIGNGCLSNNNGILHHELAVFLKGSRAPLDPQKKSISQPCNTIGSLGYASVTKDGVKNTGFILSINMEAYKNANCDWSGNIGRSCNFSFVGDSNYQDIFPSPLGFLDADTPNSKDSLYIEKS